MLLHENLEDTRWIGSILGQTLYSQRFLGLLLHCEQLMNDLHAGEVIDRRRVF